jgi:mevalonate kinase
MHTAPAKIILFGEHAVVYGQPAIAVPFPSLRTTAKAIQAPAGSGLTILARDINRVLHVHTDDETPDNALTFAAQLALRHCNTPAPDMTLEIRSTIPVASGMGSGAAVTAALIRELCAALGHSILDDDLNALVYEVEKMHHGTPSGIDNTVIVYNTPIFFIRDQPIERFHVGKPLTLLVADSGVSASTKETVGAVRKLIERKPGTYQPIIEQIGALVREVRVHIEVGNLPDVGRLMNLNHDLLGKLTVSSSLLDKLTTAARNAGALGAKLSGGGRGGNIIALAHHDDIGLVTEALRGAGAARVWNMTLKPY